MALKINMPPKMLWVLRPFRWAFKTAIFLAMLVYILIGGSASLAVFTHYYYAQQDISTLEPFIKDAVEKKDLFIVATWLNARPLSETDDLIKIITPHSGELGPTTFFELFRREVKRGNMEEALFWLQLGRFRLRFDGLRCGAPPENVRILDNLVNALPSKEINSYLYHHPEMLKKTIRRVLDFDTKYPAHDDPNGVCKIVEDSLLSEEPTWESWHRVLRKQTEAYLAGQGMTPKDSIPPVKQKP